MITAKDLQHASEDTKRRNPHIFNVHPVAGLRSTERECDSSKALVKELPGKERGKRGMGKQTGKPAMRVTIISCRRKLLDLDNVIGGYKHLRDIIAQWFNLDDNDSTMLWQYSQSQTAGKQGTVVMIERL